MQQMNRWYSRWYKFGGWFGEKKDKSTNKEPDWLDPANDRKSPYNDEEIEIFVDGFIRGLDDQKWVTMKAALVLTCINSR